MQWLTYAILLLQQNCITISLRVIGNGVGLPIFLEEETMFDFAVLADDEKATLPTQVNQILCYKSYVRTLVIIDSHWFLNFFNQYPGRTNELMPYNHVWHPTSLWGYNFKQDNLFRHTRSLTIKNAIHNTEKFMDNGKLKISKTFFGHISK